MDRALEGLRVLDLSEGVAGGYCTKLFGCMGAEVIKVEDPAGGDISRRMGPFLDHLPDPETSATYLYLNTNKKSITLNLGTTSGTETLKTLIPSVDVVVETYTPGTMEDKGIGYEVLESINPGVVLASISYFGQTGPYKNYKGNSMVGYALTGQMYQTGEADREPLVSAGFQPEYTAGIHAFDAVMAALYWRDSSGQGQHVDVSAMEAMAYYHEFSITTWTHVQAKNIRAGNDYPVGGHPLTMYPCKDGWVSISSVMPHHSENLFLLMERPDLIDDPRFSTADMRWNHKEEYNEILEAWLIQHTMDEVVDIGQSLRIPVTYVPTFGRLFEDVQLSARDYWVALEHPLAGRQLYPGAPFKMDETPWQVTRAPLLGEHNEDVYCGDMGLSKEELVRLRERNII